MRRANLFFSFLPLFKLFKVFKACNLLLSSFHSPSLPMSLPMITPDDGKKVVMTNLLTHTPMKLRDSLYTLSHLESVYKIQKNNMFLVGDTLHSESLQEWINGGDHEGHNKDNIVLSCLNCNLKKRRTSNEKFLFTKQLNLIKQS